MSVTCSLRILARNSLGMLLAMGLSGCADLFYQRLGTGHFTGRLSVEWVAPNQFIYRPSPERPLIYTTADGRTIQPRAMYTDGGSIPRLFWSSPDLGPWDFAPGYIIHDWLFLQHRCKEGDWQSWDLDKAASVLAEGIKTQMVTAERSDPVIVWAIYEAVRSPMALRSWDNPTCSLPPGDSSVSAAPRLPDSPAAIPVTIKTIDFK